MTIKSTFRSLCVSRLPTPDCEETNGLVFNAHLKSRNKGGKWRKLNKNGLNFSIMIYKQQDLFNYDNYIHFSFMYNEFEIPDKVLNNLVRQLMN